MSQQTWMFPATVESVVRSASNGHLIATAAVLWIGDNDFVMDVTYGRGNFWTVYKPRFFTSHDIAIDGVDFRHLPEPDRVIDVVVFDPPYIPQGGRDTSGVKDMLERYGLVDVPKTHRELTAYIAEGITESARVLRRGGRLFVKCMDHISGGEYIQGRHNTVEAAMAAGLVQVDEFVHHSGTGPQPPRPRQLHSRRAHSFLCIFEKRT